MDVYLKSLRNDSETFFMTIADVYSQHYHNSEYHNGNLYIIRKVDYDGNLDKTVSNELWRYNSQKKGVKLYAGKDFDFRVAPNEKYVAIRDEKLNIVNPKGTVLQTYKFSEFGSDSSRNLELGLLKWSNDGTAF